VVEAINKGEEAMTYARILSAALMSAAVAVLGFGTDARAQTKVNIGYTASGDFLPAFVAKEMGFFDKRGVDVTLTRIALASTIPAALMANSVQIGTGTGAGLLQAVEGGLDIVAVSGATRERRDNPTISVLARKAARISAPADFKGKKVGVPGLNSVIDVVFRKWLKDKGVAVEQVSLIEAPFPQMNDLLRGGTLDAVTVMEPFRSKIESDGNGVKVADFFSDVQDNMISGFWISTRAWAEANPNVVKGFREGCAEAISYIKANPEKVKAIEAKYLGVRMPGFSSFDVEIKPVDLEAYGRIGKELGLLRENVNAARLISK
jgi:NitT/TauT family transport system substrate-binding protein